MTTALRKKKNIRQCGSLEEPVDTPDSAEAAGPTVDQLVMDQQRSGRLELSPELVNATLPLLHQLAARLSSRLPPGVEQEDLFQEAVFALMKCVERFDPAKGANFITFASYRIRGAMNDYLRELDWAPRLIRSRSRKVDLARNRFFLANGRQPSDDELVCELNLPPADIERLLRDSIVIKVASLEYRRRDEEPPLHDALPDTSQDKAMDPVMRRDLRDFITNGLSRAERLIVVLYYYEGMNMREIGQTLDLSESRVCQMHTSIIARLRARLKPHNDAISSKNTNWPELG